MVTCGHGELQDFLRWDWWQLVVAARWTGRDWLWPHVTTQKDKEKCRRTCQWHWHVLDCGLFWDGLGMCCYRLATSCHRCPAWWPPPLSFQLLLRPRRVSHRPISQLLQLREQQQLRLEAVSSLVLWRSRCIHPGSIGCTLNDHFWWSTCSSCCVCSNLADGHRCSGLIFRHADVHRSQVLATGMTCRSLANLATWLSLANGKE